MSNEYFEKFCLPWPPTVNHYHQPVRSGDSVRIVKSKKARDYEKLSSIWMVRQSIKKSPSNKLAIEITLHPPTKSRYDIDNRCKAILDAICKFGAIYDDSDFLRMTVSKGLVTRGGLVEISIFELTDEST